MTAPKKTRAGTAPGSGPELLSKGRSTKPQGELSGRSAAKDIPHQRTFEARLVSSAQRSGEHKADAFEWQELVTALASPRALGTANVDESAADAKAHQTFAKASKLRALCRPCVNRRRADGAEALGYLAIDIDGGDYGKAMAALRRSRLRCVLYTTPSHGLPGNEGDRFRVIVPLVEATARADLLQDATAWLVAGVLQLRIEDVDPCSFDATHLMYLPGVFEENRKRYRHDVLDGEPCDAEDFAANAKLIGYEPPRSARATRSQDHDNVDRAALIASMASDPFAQWVQESLAFEPTHVDVSGNFVRIRCPWHAEHTTGDEAAFFIPRIGGRRAVFKCHHSHCRDRRMFELQKWAHEQGCKMVSLRLDSLFFVADSGVFVDVETMHEYPARGVDVLVPVPQWPVVQKGDKPCRLPPSAALKDNDRRQWFDTVVYDPDAPQVIEDQMIVKDADRYVSKIGARMLNTYERPSGFEDGDASKAGRWLQLFRGLYGEDADELQHALCWLASAVRYPGCKINHALVLCGAQGIGKDSLLRPIEELVGYANAMAIGADEVFDGFNAWRAKVMLKVNEVRPTNDHTLTALYERLKTTIAAPPAMLDVNEKFQPRRWVRNLVKVVITTNHVDALHVPEDDRRLFVLDTDQEPGWRDDQWFLDFHEWCTTGGTAHVRAYLETVDLSGFNPGATPPRTKAWRACVENRRSVGGDDACAVALEVLTNGDKAPPPIVFARDLTDAVARDAADDYQRETRLSTLRKRPQAVRKHMLALGYTELKNPSSVRGVWSYTRSDRQKVALGTAWVSRGVSASRVSEECKRRRRLTNDI